MLSFAKIPRPSIFFQCKIRLLYTLLFFMVCGLLYTQTPTFAAAQDMTQNQLKGMTLTLPFDITDQLNILTQILKPSLLANIKGDLAIRSLPGRGGSYAWGQLVNKTAFDETVAITSFPSIILQTMQEDPLFKEEDLTHSAVLVYLPHALWVSEKSPFRTLQDLVSYAAKQKQPVYIAGTGTFTDQQIIHTVFTRAAGIRSTYLPYIGTAQAANAVKANTAIACWGYALPIASMPGMRPLAIAAQNRGKSLPETPLFQEYNIKIISGQYYGVAVPAIRTPEGKKAISELFIKIMSDKNTRGALQAAGFFIFTVPLEQMPEFIQIQKTAINDFLQQYPFAIQ